MAARTTPKDVFLHLLAIVMLYVSVTSILTLLFQYVNELFPDVLTAEFSYRAGANLELIRTAAAALIIVFPVYLLVSWLLQRDRKQDPAKGDLPVRRWLLNLTLFLAALIIIVDLVTLMYHFLSGELTMRFLLKVVAVLLTAAAVFGYYLWELRQTASKSRVPQYSAIASGIVALLAVVAGFFIIGSPFYQRQLRFDNRRISDLATLQNQVVEFWINKDRLPSTVDELRNELQGYIPPRDPVTDQPYEYRSVSSLSFEFCAEFATEQTKEDANRTPYGGPYGEPQAELWAHGKGRACFTRTIDPEMYTQQRLYQKGVPAETVPL
ncbi:MAG: DUF5671 domain-containing protein [Candidatus Peribacteraceae bacterium]|jgi:hypothetical protein